jgi:hypothetical protein
VGGYHREHKLLGREHRALPLARRCGDAGLDGCGVWAE